MSALLMGFSTAAMAQDGTPADVDAVKNLVKAKPADYDKQIKNFVKANKKNNENLIAIGRVLMEAEDYDNARQFCTQALANSKNTYAPAYVLLGDIAAMKEDGGEAAVNYEQAIYALCIDPRSDGVPRAFANFCWHPNPGQLIFFNAGLFPGRADYSVRDVVIH